MYNDLTEKKTAHKIDRGPLLLIHHYCEFFQ